MGVSLAAPPPSAPADLPNLVAKCLKQPAIHLVRLAGGLSPRQFFRVGLPDGGHAIAMWLPEDAPERVLSRRSGRRLAFLEMREILENARVRVPRLLAAAPEQGLLIVEDLGETLAERIARDASARASLYRRAVEDLAAAQRALAELPPDSIARARAFDRELLAWEVAHFREWGIDALGGVLSAEQASAFERASDFLVSSMASFEQGFVHRDYQSRNLMALPDGSLGWIDFQDALWGPRAYDLVALLCDSYQAFDEAFVSERLAEYASARGLDGEQRERLRYEFDVITVQRKLKDAGRFVFFERARGDDSYLKYFVPSLRLVLRALSRLPRRPELVGLSSIVQSQVEIGVARGML